MPNNANTTNLPSCCMTPVDDNTAMTDSDPTTNLPSFGVAIDDPDSVRGWPDAHPMDGAMVARSGGSVSRRATLTRSTIRTGPSPPRLIKALVRCIPRYRGPHRAWTERSMSRSGNRFSYQYRSTRTVKGLTSPPGDSARRAATGREGDLRR